MAFADTKNGWYNKVRRYPESEACLYVWSIISFWQKHRDREVFLSESTCLIAGILRVRFIPGLNRLNSLIFRLGGIYRRDGELCLIPTGTIAVIRQGMEDDGDGELMTGEGVSKIYAQLP